jgi:acetyl-CoA acetyltransferase
MKSVFIYAAKRTPIGSFMGSLSTVAAPQLGASTAIAAMESISLNKKEVDEVIMGCVLPAGRIIYLGITKWLTCLCPLLCMRAMAFLR